MIDLIDLHKSFNSKRVLQGINLHIERGETMVIIGGSGSGKSVIMKHIIGIMWPDRGKVIVEEGKLLGTLSDGKFVARKIAPEILQGPAC